MTGELWGLYEIAEAYGVAPNLVDYWTGRPHFPAPDYHPAAGRFWRPSTIRRWRKRYRPELEEVS